MTTTNLRTITLEAPSASGKKFYTLDIDVTPAGYTVNFRYGAVGGAVKTGTKTNGPVDLATAEKVFDAMVKLKVDGPSHYRPVGNSSTPVVMPEPAAAECAATCLPPRLLNDIDSTMIPTLTADDRWWIEIKHDGDRVQLHVTDYTRENGGNVTLFSGRSGKIRACPKPIAQPFGPCTANGSSMFSLVLDGELVGDVLWVFDIMQADGVDLTTETYAWRYEFVRTLLLAIRHPSIRIVEAAQTQGDKVALIAHAKHTNAEGVVFVNSKAFYKAGRPNRGGDNLRWKFKASASVIVSAHNVKSSVDVMLADGTPIGTVTINKGERPPVGAIIEVEYLYCQNSLVQPAFKGIRTDVPREACTRAQLQFKDGIDPKGEATA